MSRCLPARRHLAGCADGRVVVDMPRKTVARLVLFTQGDGGALECGLCSETRQPLQLWTCGRREAGHALIAI